MEIMDAIMFLREWNDKEALEITGRKPHEWKWTSVDAPANEENHEDIVETDEYFLGYAQAMNDLSQYFSFLRGPLREKELEIEEKIKELGQETFSHYGYEGYMDKPKG